MVFTLLNLCHALFIYLFILFLYLWLCWVFVSVRGLSPAAASGGHSSSRCAGLSPSQPLPLRSTGSRRAGSATAAHGPSRSAACGILPDQGSNPCPLHWQADSQPLRHQGSPQHTFDRSWRAELSDKDLESNQLEMEPLLQMLPCVLEVKSLREPKHKPVWSPRMYHVLLLFSCKCYLRPHSQSCLSFFLLFLEG